MFQTLRLTITPLLSLIILILGSSLMTTLLTVRLDTMGVASWMIGAVSAAFYGGLVLGAFYIERLITRVGHIRAYAAFASAVAVVSLLHGLWLDAWFWLVLRFISGYSIAGLFIVIESWLLARSTVTTRGSILALYMTALYAAQSGGQLLLTVSDINTLVPFCLIAILSSLSVIPLAVTYIASPSLSEPSVLSFMNLYRISPTGVIASFASGLVLGAIYGLLPLSMSQLGFSLRDIGWLMSITIFGGMLLQYPIGRLSDKMDRRKVIMVICWLALITSFALLLVAGHIEFLYASLFFALGGFAFVLYPLATSHACDYLEPKDIVAATGGLLLAYGVGATVGPLFSSLFMHVLGARGLFVYLMAITGVLGAFIYWRSTVRDPIPVEAQQEFSIGLRTTPVANEFDPRAEAPEFKPNE